MSGLEYYAVDYCIPDGSGAFPVLSRICIVGHGTTACNEDFQKMLAIWHGVRKEEIRISHFVQQEKPRASYNRRL